MCESPQVRMKSFIFSDSVKPSCCGGFFLRMEPMIDIAFQFKLINHNHLSGASLILLLDLITTETLEAILLTLVDRIWYLFEPLFRYLRVLHKFIEKQFCLCVVLRLPQVEHGPNCLVFF